MKPDQGLSQDMEEEEEELDPWELFLELGMLIIESRMPEFSAKGRVEGPHCLLVTSRGTNHECDKGNKQCNMVSELRDQMLMLWKNGIPMCIEVLVYPDCQHVAKLYEAQLSPAEGTCVMLEEWTIQVSPKRMLDSHCGSRSLVQATRSHLHFSQLSAWLNVSRGTQPANVVYRIRAPGEAGGSKFSQPPDSHTFPVTSISKSSVLKVTVASLPRSSQIISVPCLVEDCPEHAGKTHKMPVSSPVNAGDCSFKKKLVVSNFPSAADRNIMPVSSSVGAATGYGGRSSKTTVSKSQKVTEAQVSGPCKTPLSNSPVDAAELKLHLLGQSKQSQQSAMQQKQQQQQQQCNCFEQKQLQQQQQQCNYCEKIDHNDADKTICENSGAIPKRKHVNHQKVTCSQYMSKSPVQPPNHLDLSSSKEYRKERSLVSPKVLLTSNLPGQGYFSTEGFQSGSNSPSLEDHFDVDLDYYLSDLALTKSSREKQDSNSLGKFVDPFAHQQTLPVSIQTQLEVDVKEVSSSLNGFHTMSKSLDKDSGLESNGNQSDLYEIQKTTNGNCEKEEKVIDDFERICDKIQAKLFLSDFGSFEKENISKKEPERTRRQSESDTFNDTSAEELNFKSISELSKSNNLSSSLELSHCQSKGALTPSTPSEQNIAPQPLSRNGAEADDSVKFYLDDNDEYLDSSSSSNKQQETPAVPPSKKTSTCRKLTQQFSPCNARRPFPKSPTDAPSVPGFGGFSKSCPLIKSLLKKEPMTAQSQGKEEPKSTSKPIPTQEDKENFKRSLSSCSSMLFHAQTGLPMQSSPAPQKRRTFSSFDFDYSLTNIKAIKSALSMSTLSSSGEEGKELSDQEKRILSTSAPASTNSNSLLGNFEESLLNGRIMPAGTVAGFTAEIGASGSFCPKHISLPVTAFFFNNLSDDNAPSPYLGHVNLESANLKRGYHVPKKGTVQVTLFNPNKTVVKMFVVMYDLSDMPPNCQTFIRQRTLYMPVSGSAEDQCFLRYLIHLRFASSKSGKVYLHTDIRLIFARDKFEFDPRVASYELRSFTEVPSNPTYSPKR